MSLIDAFWLASGGCAERSGVCVDAPTFGEMVAEVIGPVEVIVVVVVLGCVVPGPEFGDAVVVLVAVLPGVLVTVAPDVLVAALGRLFAFAAEAFGDVFPVVFWLFAFAPGRGGAVFTTGVGVALILINFYFKKEKIFDFD